MFCRVGDFRVLHCRLGLEDPIVDCFLAFDGLSNMEEYWLGSSQTVAPLEFV